MRTIVRAVDHDGVVGDAEIVERLEQLSDVAVVLDHAVGILIPRHAALPDHRRPHMREDVHARGVHPGEERLVGLRLPRHEVDGGSRSLVVDRLHPLAVERTGVLDGLLADLAPMRLIGEIISDAGLAFHDATWRVSAGVCLVVLRPIGTFRLLLGIQVIEVAEELVEAVNAGKEFVPVAEMVLAELAGGVAERLKRFGDGDVCCLESDGRTGNTDFRHAGTLGCLAGEER